MAQDKLARASSKDSSQSISGSQHSHIPPIQDGKDKQHSRVSDENICQVVCNFHDHSQHDRETQEVYQACKVMSAHIHRNSEVVENVPQTEITQKDDILEDLSQLYAKQVEHNTKQVQHEKEDNVAHCSSKCLRYLTDWKRSA